MVALSDVNINTALLAALSGLAGWVLRDVRNRVRRTEDKLEAVVVAVFYMIATDTKVPDDARAAIRKAMLSK